MNELKLYLDTSVFSAYYDDRDISRMKQTGEFWEMLKDYELYISTIVIDELGAISDKALSRQVLALTKPFTVLEIDDEVEQLADRYLIEGLVPERELNDALHLASTTKYELDILVSWNFHHLVKWKTRIMVNKINNLYEYRKIEIIAPPEL